MRFLYLSLFFLIHLSADIKWDRPIDLSDGEVDPKAYGLSVNSKGDAVAIWVEEKIMGPIKAATKLSEEEWSFPHNLFSSQGMNPRSVIDEEGTVTAIWMNHLPYGNILSAIKSRDGNWAYQALSSGFSLNPRLSIDDQGAVLVTWKDKKTGKFFSLTKSLHQDWSSQTELFKIKKEAVYRPELKFSSKYAVSDLQVVYDKDDHTLVVFKDLDSQKFAFATKTPQSEWSEPSFFTIGFIEENPIVKLSADGQIFILWQDTYSKHLFITTGVWETQL